MTNTKSISGFWAHLGYIAGINNEDPDSRLDYPGSEYEAGYLTGMKDREAGITLPKFFGYHSNEELPVSKGMEVTIPKGTPILFRGEVKVAKKTYKVKVDHVLNGSCVYGHHHHGIQKATNPSVRWPSTGGYWAEVDINHIPEAIQS